MANENRIQIVVEAYNMAKTTLDALGKQIKDLGDGASATGRQHDSVFQKMKENWVAISVVAAEVGLVVREAWEYMEAGAKAQQAEASFRSVAAAAGESADEILEAMKRAANGTMDDSAIMQKAAKGMVQGLSGDQMVNIMEAARTAARVTGQDVSSTYETITDAIANKMPRALLQYGLVTKEQVRLLNEALAMGVTEVDLYALAMENAANQTDKIGPALDNNAEKLQRWKAIFEEIKETIGKAIFWIIDNVIGRLLNVVADVAAIVADLFARIGMLWTWMTSGFKGGMAELTKQNVILDQALHEQFQENNAKYGGTPKSALVATGTKSSSTNETGADQQLRDIVKAHAQVQTFEDALTNLDSAEKTRETSHLAAAEQRLEIEQQIVNLLQKQYDSKTFDEKEGKWKNTVADPNARAALLKQIDDAKKKMTDFRLALRELNGDFQTGFNEGLQRYIDSVGSTFQQAVKLAQEAAQAMQQAFSDFFFDIMTGKLKHFSDYINSFLLSIARAIANMMAGQAAQGIVGSFAGAFGSGAGAGGGSNATMNTGGGGFAHDGAYIMHQGGYVPRFHVGGLMSDERPAILQTGEGVLSRRGMAALDSLNNGGGSGGGPVSVAVTVINQSSQPVQAKQGATRFDGKQLVTSVILSDFESNGPLRNAIGGLR